MLDGRRRLAEARLGVGDDAVDDGVDAGRLDGRAHGADRLRHRAVDSAAVEGHDVAGAFDDAQNGHGRSPGMDLDLPTYGHPPGPVNYILWTTPEWSPDHSGVVAGRLRSRGHPVTSRPWARSFRITDGLRGFIERQQLFFVATAPLAGGHVNLSPKGMDSFRVLGPTTVAYLDNVGSGNETAAHVLENGRITFMFCAFEGSPLILRLYGTGPVGAPGRRRMVHAGSGLSVPSRHPADHRGRADAGADVLRRRRALLQLHRRTRAAGRVGRRAGSRGPGGLPAREERPQHRRPAQPR